MNNSANNNFCQCGSLVDLVYKKVEASEAMSLQDFVKQITVQSQTKVVNASKHVTFTVDQLQEELEKHGKQLSNKILGFYTKLFTKKYEYQYVAECINKCGQSKPKNLAPQLLFEISFQQQQKNVESINPSIECDNRFYYDMVMCPKEKEVREMKIIQFKSKIHVINYYCLSCGHTFEPAHSHEYKINGKQS